MITIHHLEDSRSQRVLWLLEELGLPYEVKRYERGPDMRAPKALRDVHPLGKSPVLTDDSRTVAETGAIVEYILSVHGDGRLMPPDGTDAYWQARHFLHYAEGSAMPPLLLALVLGMIPKRAPALLKPILAPVMGKVRATVVDPDLDRHLDHWEGALGQSGWFAGDEMSVADIMMSFPVEAAATRVDYSQRPALRAFLERIHARPAFARALERGGPYAYA